MGLVLPALVGAGTSWFVADKTRKATHEAKDANAEIIANLKYEPIDVDKLKAEVTQQSIDNARASIALEKEISPSIAGMRTELPRQIQQELTMGGRLSPDVANQVAQQARTIGGGTGTFSGVGPITAALTGTTAQNLIDQRQTKAANMLSQNQLPTVGLDPGSLASLQVAQNAAQNQFNLSKAGLASNMTNSNLQGNMASIGATAGLMQSLIGSGGLMNPMTWRS